MKEQSRSALAFNFKRLLPLCQMCVNVIEEVIPLRINPLFQYPPVDIATERGQFNRLAMQRVTVPDTNHYKGLIVVPSLQSDG